MLRLRRVEMFGFKSFAERTRILFNGSGVAAVVGPNGCGKSNISDAILWVLGEQSAKTLRSGRMADCIFNGTATRPPTNLAEVTLTLVDPEAETAGLEAPSAAATAAKQVEAAAAPAPNDTQAALPEGGQAAEASVPEAKKPAKRNRLNLKILPGEVVVTRRLYRDGTSEYYLNGELCRLRDIQELFMGTGLGPESYAIIEQGRVGQILSSRPSDRRALIEEAAGVTRYKTKRRLAEAKLEAARQNLLRLNDIFEEIVKQLNSLKRQAGRARRYQELKTEGTALRRRLLATELEELRAAEAALAARLDANATELEKLSAVLAEEEQQQTGAQTRQYELETTLRQEQNRAGQVLVELERAQSRVADTRRRQAEVAQRLEELAAREQALAAESAAAVAQAEQNRAFCADLEEEFSAVTAESETLAAASDARRRDAAGFETAQQERLERQAALSTRLATLRAETAQLEQQAESSGEQTSRLAAERQLTRQQRLRLEMEIKELETSLARARGERARAAENVAAAERELAACHQESEAEQRRAEELHRSLAQAQAQQNALEELVAHRAALAEPVQKLLLGSGGLSAETEFRAVGVVADFAELDPSYAPLLEDYLHDELEYVVVETYDAARSGVSLLREQSAGRATFLVDSFGRFPPKLAEEASRPDGAGLVGHVSDFVHMNGPLGSEAKRVLPKLGHTYLVESARAAEQLARDFPQYFFLSTDGTCYHGRLVSGGAHNGYGSHALVRDLESARQRRAEVEPVAGSAESDLRRLESRRRELERAVEQARQALLAREKDLIQLEQQLEAQLAARARWEAEEARAAQELSQRDAGERRASDHLAALRDELVRLEQDLPALEAEIQRAANTFSDTRRQLEAAAARLAELGARRAGLEERLRAARQDQQRLDDTSARLATEQTQQAEFKLRLEAEVERLAQELVSCQAEVEQRQQDKVELEARCVTGEAELLALRQALVERESALRARRGQLDALREERHRFEVECARHDSDRQHAELACQSEFGLTAQQLCGETAERLTAEELLPTRARYQEIKERLETIGPVNMMALEELTECEERHEFLTQQRADILASIEDTTRAITEIDTVSRERFERAFAVINQNFTETFKTLFGGGTATLRLTEAEDPGDAGIELICQPPGKRLQNVLLLSGGEKALTALALLIAIFRYQPSPFCILDEVDAPLDDTNVGRFTRLVQDMAPQTQFILITHNKKTMEIAPMLYGVTMQAAVSQIVSVRFDDSDQAAAPASAA